MEINAVYSGNANFFKVAYSYLNASHAMTDVRRTEKNDFIRFMSFFFFFQKPEITDRNHRCPSKKKNIYFILPNVFPCEKNPLLQNVCFLHFWHYFRYNRRRRRRRHRRDGHANKLQHKPKLTSVKLLFFLGRPLCDVIPRR